MEGEGGTFKAATGAPEKVTKEQRTANDKAHYRLRKKDLHLATLAGLRQDRVQGGDILT